MNSFSSKRACLFIVRVTILTVWVLRSASAQSIRNLSMKMRWTG